MASLLKLRHKRAKSGDLESGPSTPTSPTHDEQEKQQNGDAAGEPNYDGEEYDVLLRYAKDQAERAEKHDDEEDEGEGKRRRVWYAPWKTVAVQSDKERKIPDDWLQTNMTQGLADNDVETRRKQFGYNELTSPKENQFLKFISYFRGPILYTMEIAVILSAGLQDWIDFGVIIGILFLNAGVGWYQEKQAGDIVAELKAGIAMKAFVVRGGQEREIEARELCPGDIVILEEGNTIPADARILASYDDKDGAKAKEIQAKSGASKKRDEAGDDENDDGGEEDRGPSVLSVDQSAITGESLAVDKYIGDVAYYTCGVKRGKCYAMVSATAKQSFVGRTASLVMSSNETGHFQIVLGGIGTALLVLVLVFIFIVWVGGFFRGIGIASPKENSLLVYALVFFIIGVPVGLPCVTTTTMAVGAAYLARRKCIVQKLTAIESLAGVDMLCSDKTGTLTANKLSLNEPYVSPGVDRDWFMTVAVLASSHNIKSLDPIDKVTIIGLKDFPGAQENLRSGWKTHKFTPFDPVSKRIEAEVEKDGRKYVACKGAPNAILKLRKFDVKTVNEYRQMSQNFAEKGFRSLGVAIKEEGKEWELLGIMSMFDPPRADTASTVREAQDLGIHIKMLTGDAVAIAKETCKQLQLGTNVYDSQRLIGSGMSGSDVRDFVEAADGFAEVFPEHKYQVVEMLQQRGHLTAMTGDGVNDAPSLKKADCGIAVEGASDAARSAADVVFLDEGLNSIITSIKVARQIFHRMKAYIIYRIALCIHLEVYLALSMLILNETIRVDLIVFLAIFADVATIAIAYDRAPYAKSPVEWELPKVWVISTVMGLILAAGTWAIRGTLIRDPTGGIIQNFGSVQEILFLEVALTESWVIFVTRLSQGNDEENVLPSFQLLAAVFGVDILASLFCLFGWISGDATHHGHVDIVTVVRIWCFSFGITVVVALAYYVLNKWDWLGQLGRLPRSKKNEKLENFLAELQRLTIHHERGQEGDDYYRIGASETQKDDEESEHKSKGANAKKKEGKAKDDEQTEDGDGGGGQTRESQGGENTDAGGKEGEVGGTDAAQGQR
ncbi:putative hydrogen-exporting ATPase [Mycena metata]|uniref:Plasma membrane ATPase n=1 Tax=Mycena metata TaxID=1033252 RepID=A0AAD7JP98_9AGAR|nr:putative hydrogen-exporting ATPase [Mycena metata]